MRREAADFIDDSLDLLAEHARGILQSLEFALAGRNGDLLRAQFRLRLLQASLELGLLAQERPLLAAHFADAFLQRGHCLAQIGDLILASEDGRGGLAGAMPVEVAARINAVPVEQIARGRDKVKGSVGRAPGLRRGRQIRRDQSLSQQPVQ